jgi:hypothetical protein
MAQQPDIEKTAAAAGLLSVKFKAAQEKILYSSYYGDRIPKL